jgi:hypothetical protein
VAYVEHHCGVNVLRFWFTANAIKESRMNEEYWDDERKEVVTRHGKAMKGNATEQHWWETDDMANIDDVVSDCPPDDVFFDPSIADCLFDDNNTVATVRMTPSVQSQMTPISEITIDSQAQASRIEALEAKACQFELEAQMSKQALNDLQLASIHSGDSAN